MLNDESHSPGGMVGAGGDSKLAVSGSLALLAGFRAETTFLSYAMGLSEG